MMRTKLTFLLAAAAAIIAGCGAEGEVILTVGESSYTIGELADYYARLDPATRPIISSHEDAKDYLEAFSNKALLETAAREAGYYENPMAVAEYEIWRRGNLINMLQQRLTAEVTVTEEELDAWTKRHLSEGVYISLIQLSSEAEARAAHERLKAGEDFGRVARETFYMRSPGDIFLAQAGGVNEPPLQWSPSRRNQAILALKKGEFSEPLFYDLHNEHVYYIFLNRGPAPREAFMSTDPERLRPRLREEMLFERAKQIWNSHLADARSRATVEVNQGFLDALDSILDGVYRRSLKEGLLKDRSFKLSLTTDDLVGLGSTTEEPSPLARDIAARSNARRNMMAEALSPFFNEHKNDYLVKVNGVSVPLRYCTHNLLLWLSIDDVRILEPASRRELLRRFVEESVKDQLAVEEAERLGLDTKEPFAAKLARKRDEIAVTLFRQEQFLERMPRPTEEEVRRRYEETVDRFVYGEKIAYYLALLPERERAEELRALLADDANFSPEASPVASLAEIETRPPGEPLARSREELLRLIIAEESLDKQTASIHRTVQRNEADDYTRVGFGRPQGYLSPVTAGERDGVKGYGILYVVDALPASNRTLENDPGVHGYLVDELMREAEPRLFENFLEELQKKYPVFSDLDLVDELFDALLDASRTAPGA